MKFNRIYLQLFAGDKNDPPADPPKKEDPPTDPNGGAKPDDDGGKTFSQEELDAVITKRLARERKAWETQLEEEKKKAAMSETERLQAEKAEAEKKSAEVMTKANRALVTAEAKGVAAELGVKPERLAHAVRLAELAEVEVQDGEVDTAAIKVAMKKVLEELPELKGQPNRNNIGSGTNPGQTAPKNADMNAFIRARGGR